MLNRVERELIRLREKLSKIYDFEEMKKIYYSGDFDTISSMIIRDNDINQALTYWFGARIRVVDDRVKRTPVSSTTIKNAIYEDIGLTIPPNIIAATMHELIYHFDSANILRHDGITPFDTAFLFSNIELIELDKCAPLKIFIAQPMSGVPDEEVEKIREHVTKLMLDKYGSYIEILDQFHVPEEEMPDELLARPGIHLLGRSIQFLADVDLVVFVGDFLHAKGCCVELAVCKEYDIPFEVCGIDSGDTSSSTMIRDKYKGDLSHYTDILGNE